MTFSRPNPDAATRAARALDKRKKAAHAQNVLAKKDIAYAGDLGFANGDENTPGSSYATNFTKGLPHNDLGNVAREDYACFVEAINRPSTHNPDAFDVPMGPPKAPGANEGQCAQAGWNAVQDFSLKILPTTGKETEVRGWESPRAGHAYDPEGADSGAVGMAPAPALGSDELTAEMAEVYALALLRDTFFSEIQNDSSTPHPKFGCSPQDILGALNKLPYFQSSAGLDKFAEMRRAARLDEHDALSSQVAFRGSTKGAKKGSYISQFMLMGKDPALSGEDSTRSGRIPFGSQHIDQKTAYYVEGADYMSNWSSWLDVQNGANFKGLGALSETNNQRFVCVPRDLAAYVHDDALYQAYLNATLLLLSAGDIDGESVFDEGFPEPNGSKTRTPFATFGGPHILALVPEVSSRALKAVRRQKFGIHRRCRPEQLAGMITRVANGETDGLSQFEIDALTKMYADLNASGLLNWVATANKTATNFWKTQDGGKYAAVAGGNPPWLADEKNFLLPMAFPEGSPMHPAYGAGHATVAGACVTIIKAFFQMFEKKAGDKHSWEELTLDQYKLEGQYHSNGRVLDDVANPVPLTVNGELDKLAANISIGRNMAGVHFYSDYFDSLRMGERVAVSLLLDQLPGFEEPITLRFLSFDGDQITLESESNGKEYEASLLVNGSLKQAAHWRVKHLTLNATG